MTKLEEEAAGIALATEEEYMQYQQLKQVPPLFRLLLLSFPFNCLCPSFPFASASCLTAHSFAGTSCHCPCPCPFCMLLPSSPHLTLLLLPLLPFRLPLLMAWLLPFHLPLSIVLTPFRLPLPFCFLPFSSCPLTLALQFLPLPSCMGITT